MYKLIRRHAMHIFPVYMVKLIKKMQITRVPFKLLGNTIPTFESSK